MLHGNSTLRRHGRLTAITAGISVVVTVAGLAAVVPNAEAKQPTSAMKSLPVGGVHPQKTWKPSPLPKTRSIRTRSLRADVGPVKPSPNDARNQYRPTVPVWPTASDRAVRLDASAGRASAARPRASSSATTSAGTPFTIAPAGRLTRGLLHGAARRADAKLVAKSKAGPSGSARTAGMRPTVATARLQVETQARAHALGVRGVVFTLAPTSNDPRHLVASVGLSYAQFADAFGGGYGARLRLVRLPACALTLPRRTRCQTQTPIPTAANDARHQRVVADIALTNDVTQTGGKTGSASAPAASPTVLAATTSPSSGGGDYRATSLSEASSWSAGDSSGAFNYSVPITTPPAPGGAAPSVALSYDSAAVDGLTSTTNTQASWVGDGWDYSPGYIERSYKACAADGQSDSGDECWLKDNATINLNGHSSRLVPTGTGTWRMESDDGSIIDEVNVSTSSAFYNGLNNGTYWRLTEQDGTQYSFGADHLPSSVGGDGTDASTEAAWGVPVYGNDAGEPCHASTFNASSCTQGWRWNLDFIADPHGNLSVFHYTRETNYYKAGEVGTGTLRQYTRGGALTKITYGQQVADYLAGSAAADRVVFDTVQRCDGSGGFDCSTAISSANASHWPDVPYDQNCDSAGSCDNYSPTFWTQLALSNITTQIWDRSLTTPGWTTVDTYALSKPAFPDPNGGSNGDATSALWLDSVTHTGADTDGGGNAVTSAPIQFNGSEPLPNRVQGGQLNVVDITRYRLAGIYTETGEQIEVAYDESQSCDRANPPAEDNDHQKCFPVRWTPGGYANPVLDWFYTYPVTAVAVTDNGNVWGSNESPQHLTNYSYSGPAWHRDDSEFTPDNQRTWGEFRGYAHVTVTTGQSPDPITQSTTDYLQGMDGDRMKDGTQRTATVSTYTGDTLTDSSQYAGYAYQTASFSSSSGTPQLETVSEPWHSTATADQARSGDLPDLKAMYIGTTLTDTRQKLADGTWRTARVATTYDDASGLPTAVDDLGEINASGNPVAATSTPEKCTTTQYAQNLAKNMLDYPDEIIATAGGCSNTIGTNTLSAVKTLYDNSTTFGQLSGPGDPTSTQALKSYTTTASWAAAASLVYDQYGRTTSSTDPMGRTTQTSYGTTATDRSYLPTTITTTNPMGWTSTVGLDPARQLPVSTTDENGNVTTQNYDGLGRLVSVWDPNHPEAQNSNLPSTKYSYRVTTTAPIAVTTSTLQDDSQYTDTVDIYDGMLQLRQTQATPANGAAGARVINTTRYDSHGWTAVAFAPFYNNTSAPSTAFAVVSDDQIPSATQTSYDGQGRATATTWYAYAQPQWSTSTTYSGANVVDTTPADGGTATESVYDARGQETKLIENPNGPLANDTYYYYDAAGRRSRLVGPIAPSADPSTNNQSWTWTYNAHGDVTTSTDPDTGTTTTSYNDDSEPTKVSTTGSETGATTTTVSTDYDALGRATATHRGSSTGAVISRWTYDTAGALGQLAKSTRYADDGTTATYTDQVSGYTSTYQPTGDTITIPKGTYANVGGITYTTVDNYTPIRDELYNQTITDSAGQIMAKENYGISYNTTGLPVATGGLDYYEANTNYDPYGRVLRATSGVMPNEAVITNSFDEPSSRTTDTAVSAEGATSAVDDIHYTYNQAGDITSATDLRNGGGTSALTDRQCYLYDSLRRLSDVWTDSVATTPAAPGAGDIAGCKTTDPSTATLSGPAPYWQHYGYTLSGNRNSTATTTGTGTSATSTTTTDKYNAVAAGVDTPHSVHTVTTGTTTTTYTYNGGRPLTSTTAVSGTVDKSQTQAYTWTPDGRLDTLTTGPTGGDHTSTSYGYDADGNQIARQIATTSSGTTTVATAITIGLDTITINSTGTNNAAASQVTREYPFPGGMTAVRVSTSTNGTITTALHYQATDNHGTPIVDITADTNAVTRRPETPFGEIRPAGHTGSHWASPVRQFLGSLPDSSTGLTTLGARQYDALLGQFISTDPELDASDPQSLNGYSYAHDNPLNASDPAGLSCIPDEPCNDNATSGGGGGSGPSQVRNTNYDDSQEYESYEQTFEAPAASAASSFNRAGPHNDAVRAARMALIAQYHLDPAGFVPYRRINNAAKRCMSGDPDMGCGYGVPDIIYNEPGTNTYVIWEVKSATIGGSPGTAAAIARAEAQWYVSWMNKEKDTIAELGGEFDPIEYSTGQVWGPGEGAALYRTNTPPRRPAPLPEPQPQPGPRMVPVPARTATPTPAPPEAVPAPGGLILNPGSGYVVPAAVGAAGVVGAIGVLLRLGLFAAE